MASFRLSHLICLALSTITLLEDRILPVAQAFETTKYEVVDSEDTTTTKGNTVNLKDPAFTLSTGRKQPLQQQRR